MGTPFVGGSYEFLARRRTPARCAFLHVLLRHGHHSGDGRSRVPAGVGVRRAFVDANGRPFDGAKTYRLHLPPNVPARQFWSLVLYDNQTRSMLQTDQQFPSIGSQKKGVAINPDKSVDVYFGPEAAAGP